MPRFRDRRPLVYWGVFVIVPALVLIFSGIVLGFAAGTVVLLAITGIVYTVVGSLLFLAFSLPNRVR